MHRRPGARHHGNTVGRSARDPIGLFPTAPASPYGPDMAVVRPHRGLRIGLAAALLATLAAGAGGGMPVREADAGVAPRCAYADTVTRYVARSDWYRSLLDTRYRLTAGVRARRTSCP